VCCAADEPAQGGALRLERRVPDAHRPRRVCRAAQRSLHDASRPCRSRRAGQCNVCNARFMPPLKDAVSVIYVTYVTCVTRVMYAMCATLSSSSARFPPKPPWVPPSRSWLSPTPPIGGKYGGRSCRHRAARVCWLSRIEIVWSTRRGTGTRCIDCM